MSRGINKVILVGNVGQDPEVRYLPNGGAVANVSLATSDSWMDKNSGQRQERTEWHRVVFFGKLADVVGQYVKKGSKLYVEGKLQTRKWQDQSGQDRYTTEIVVDGFSGQMQMLDGRGEGNATGGGMSNQGFAQSAPQSNYQQAPAAASYQQPGYGQNDYSSNPSMPPQRPAPQQAAPQQTAPQQAVPHQMPPQPQSAPQQPPVQQPSQHFGSPASAGQGFDDFDDDIPF